MQKHRAGARQTTSRARRLVEISIATVSKQPLVYVIYHLHKSKGKATVFFGVKDYIARSSSVGV